MTPFPPNHLALLAHRRGALAAELRTDEVMHREANAAGGVAFRTWEPRDEGHVLGCSGRSAVEILDGGGLPILRRFSGGGAVYMGPGVLAYALVLPEPYLRALPGVRASFALLGAFLCEALSGMGLKAAWAGGTDLCLGQRKLGGNAQSRTGRALCQHGTLLVAPRLARLEGLAHPPREPTYRRGRPHRAFVTTLRDEGVDAPVEEVARLLAEAFLRRSGELVRLVTGEVPVWTRGPAPSAPPPRPGLRTQPVEDRAAVDPTPGGP
ncbi:MAG: hypothetical protein HY722_03270 [Planctomycetes bacterium]|nr:hypothetical protein [Planctomycetota bacterium]